jgi:hypothetical protein
MSQPEVWCAQDVGGEGESWLKYKRFRKRGVGGGESCKQKHGIIADRCMYMYHHIKFITVH